MTSSAAPRTVSVFSLGGTIAMASLANNSAGVVPSLDAAALLAAVPALSELGLKITARSFRGLPGASLSFEDLSQLVSVIQNEFDTGVDGIVITQGTDTIEETAYFLDLTVDRTGPVVVTGAMRNPTIASADGPGNLLAAVQTAASTRLTGVGCVVVMADEIHAAKHVHKVHSMSIGLGLKRSARHRLDLGRGLVSWSRASGTAPGLPAKLDVSPREGPRSSRCRAHHLRPPGHSRHRILVRSAGW